MEALRGLPEDDFSHDLRVTDVAIKNGRVTSTTHDMTSFWSKWCTYVQSCNIDPYLQSVTFGNIIKNVCGFAGRVREGYLGRVDRVSCTQVQIAVRAIGQTCELDKGCKPLYRAPENI